jgi:hypothetical protein
VRVASSTGAVDQAARSTTASHQQAAAIVTRARAGAAGLGRYGLGRVSASLVSSRADPARVLRRQLRSLQPSPALIACIGDPGRCCHPHRLECVYISCTRAQALLPEPAAQPCPPPIRQPNGSVEDPGAVVVVSAASITRPAQTNCPGVDRKPPWFSEGCGFRSLVVKARGIDFFEDV